MAYDYNRLKRIKARNTAEQHIIYDSDENDNSGYDYSRLEKIKARNAAENMTVSSTPKATATSAPKATATGAQTATAGTGTGKAAAVTYAESKSNPNNKNVSYNMMTESEFKRRKQAGGGKYSTNSGRTYTNYTDYVNEGKVRERESELEEVMEEQNKNGKTALADKFFNAIGAAGGRQSPEDHTSIKKRNAYKAKYNLTEDQVNQDLTDYRETKRTQKYERYRNNKDFEEKSKTTDGGDILTLMNKVDGGTGNLIDLPDFLELGPTNTGSNPYAYTSALTEDELKMYRYIYNTQGDKASEKYLKDLEYTAGKRLVEQEKTKLGEESGGRLAARSAQSVISNLIGGPVAAVSDVYHTIKGEDINPYDQAHVLQNYTQDVRNATAERIEENTDAEIAGRNVWSFLYQTGMSAADSAVGAATMGTAYTFVMGSSAASQRAGELYEQGASREQVIAGSLAAGAAEMIFEKFSIENLINTSSAKSVTEAVLNILKQAGIEASEEAATEIANKITDSAIRGKTSDRAQKIRTYMDNGMSEDEARKAVIKEDVGDILTSAIGGAISGGMLGGLATAQRTATDYRSGKAINEYGNGRALIDEVRQFNSNAQNAGETGGISGDLATDYENYINKKNGRADTIGGNIRAGNLQRVALQEAEQAYQNARNAKTPYSQIKSDISDIMAGEEDYGRRDVNRMSRAAEKLINGRNIGINEMVRAGNVIASNNDVDSYVAEQIDRRGIADELGKSYRNIADASRKSFAPEKTYIFSDDKTREAMTVDDETGKAVPLKEYTPTDETKKTLINRAKNMPAEIADIYVNAYKGEDIDDYDRAFQRVKTWGRLGGHEDMLTYEGFNASDYFTDEQKKQILKYGLESKEIKTGLTNYSTNQKLLNQHGKTMLALVDRIAKDTDFEVVLFDQLSDKDGKSAYNGAFTKQANRIALSLDSDKGLLLRTLAHEQGHFIKLHNEQGFDKLTNLVQQAYEGRDDERAKLFEKYKGQNYADKNQLEELVCDSLFDVYDEDFIRNLVNEDKGLAKQLKSKLDNFISAMNLNLKSMELSGNHDEMVAIRADEKRLKDVQRIFNEELAKASANFRASVGAESKPQIDSRLDSILDESEPETERNVKRVTLENGEEVIEEDLPFSTKDVKGKEDKKYFDAIEKYGEDSEEVRSAVEKAAEKAGYTRKGYHGTRSFGFTTFDSSFSDDNLSFFVAEDSNTARSYSGTSQVRKIKDNIDVAKLSAEQIAGKLNEYGNQKLVSKEKYGLLTQNAADDYITKADNYIKDLFAGNKLESMIESQKKFVDSMPGDFSFVRKNALDRFNYLNALSSAIRNKNYKKIGTAARDITYVGDSALDENADEIEWSEWNKLSLTAIAAADAKEAIRSGDKFIYDEFENGRVEFLNLDDARAMLSEMQGVGNYELYLNPDNLWVIDCNGKNWNEIRLPEDKHQEAMDYAVYNGFDVTDEVYNNYKLTTRDVAEMAKELGYDGVEFQNVIDNGGQAEGTGAATVYAIFNPNALKSADPVTYDDYGKVIPLSERFESKLDDIRFQAKDPVEETRDLVAVHNIAPDDLEKTWALGGFPMPSIAILKAQMGHEQYGTVSVVFDKSAIDPQSNRKNKVYSGDAWTPTFPGIEYKPNTAVESKVRDLYYNLEKEYGYDAVRPLYNYVYDLERVLNSNGGEQGLKSKLYEDTEMMRVFNLTEGKEIENVYNENRVEMPEDVVLTSKNLLDHFGTEALVKLRDGRNTLPNVSKFADENRNEIREVYRQGLLNDGLSEEEAEDFLRGVDKTTMVKGIRNAIRYAENGPVTVNRVFDSNATREKIKSETEQEKYKAWIDELFTGAEEKQGIYNGKDYITDNGRRSWEALHYEVSLENIVKAMAQKANGEQAPFSGLGIWGAAAKEYNSIREIKNDESRLQKIDEDEYGQLKQEMGERLSKIAETIADKRMENQFIAIDDAMANICDAVRTRKSKAGIKNYLSQYHSNITDGIVDDIISLVNDIANMPTGYFEAKPQRAVGFDEVAAVIIPSDTKESLRSLLNESGVNVVEYEAGNEKDRLEKLNSLEDVKFSKKDAPTEMDAYYDDVIRENDALQMIFANIEDTVDMQRKAETLDRSEIDKLVKRILKEEHSSDENFGKAVHTAFDYMAQAGNNIDSDAVTQYLMQATSKMLQKSEYLDDEAYRETKWVRDRLRTDGLYVPEEDMKSVASEFGYSSPAQMRRHLFGKIRIVNDERATGYWTKARFKTQPEFEEKGYARVDGVKYTDYLEYQRAIVRYNMDSKNRAGRPLSIDDFYAQMASDPALKPYFPFEDFENDPYRGLVEFLEVTKPRYYEPFGEDLSWSESSGPAWARKKSKLQGVYNMYLEEAAADKTAELLKEYYNITRVQTDQQKMLQYKYDIDRQYQQFKQDLRNDYNKKLKRAKMELREANREYVNDYRDRRENADRRRVLNNNIDRNWKFLNTRLEDRSKSKHIPDGLEGLAYAMVKALPGGDTGAKRVRFNRGDLLALEAEYDKTIKRMFPEGKDDNIGSGVRADLDDLNSQFVKLIDKIAPVPSKGDDGYKTAPAAIRSALSTEDLGILSNVTANIRHLVDTANKLFGEEKQATVDEVAERVMHEMKRGQQSRFQRGSRNKQTERLKGLDEFRGSLTKPEYLFKNSGSEELYDLYKDVRRGENTEAEILRNAKEFLQKAKAKHNFDPTWATKTVSITTDTGVKLNMTQEDAMYIFALARRKQGMKHLVGDIEKNQIGGGVIINDVETGKLVKSKLSPNDLGKIGAKLSNDQVAYTKEVMDYLSKTVGEERNKVSMALMGFKKYVENNYLPIQVASETLEQNVNRQKGSTTIANQGASKTLDKEAKNAIQVSGFDDIVLKHIYDSALYCGYAVPTENLNKVWNAKTADGTLIHGVIEWRNGVNDTKQMHQLIKDLNEGQMSESQMKIANSFFTKAKKAATMANISVIVQQPTAVFRAMRYIEPKYFATVATKADLDEMYENNGCAVKKSIGYYDVNVGKTAIDWMAEYKPGANVKSQWTSQERRQQFNLKDKVETIASYGAEKADEITWGAIWNAAKNKVKAEQHLSGDEMLKAAAEIFQDTILKTQVYDSVFSKSALLRSADFGDKLVGAFMSEPLTNLNMLSDAVYNRKKTGNGPVIQSFAAVTASLVVNAACKAIVQSFRQKDDKDEKDFLVKYLAHIPANVLDDVFGMVPYVNTIIDIYKGFKAERMDVQFAGTVFKALITVGKVISKEDAGYEDYKKAIMQMTNAIAQMTGIPAYNAVRDVWTASEKLYDRIVNNEANVPFSVDDLALATAEEIGLDTSIDYGKYVDKYLSGKESYKKTMERIGDDENKRKQVTTAIGKKYRAGTISKSDAKHALIMLSGKTPSEADTYIKTQDTRMKKERESQ